MKKIFKAGVLFGSLVAVFGFFLNMSCKNKNTIRENKSRPFGKYEKYFKRPLDFVLSTFALITLSPVILIIAILVKIKLGSPVLFSQERPGKDEKIFKLYKFRSMTDKKDKDGNLLSDEERLTEFGKRLRSTSLDELPELLNIIKGDMSFVGPRPLLISYLPYYSEREKKRHSVRPGLTGLAQVSGRNNLKWDERFELDVKYSENISFIGDMNIILLTIQKVLIHADISVDSSVSEGNFAKLREQGKV